MKARVLTGVLALLVAVVGGAVFYLWRSNYSASALVMRQVRAALVDPESARFQDVRAFSETKAGCGVVNAKNRMGGYIGNTRFVALPDGNVIFEPQSDDGTGALEVQLERAKQVLAFLNIAVANCPEAPAR